MKDMTELRALVVPRFMAYTRYNTESDRHNQATPSTPGQWDLARALVEELRGLGIADVRLTEHCYVIARLPATPGQEGLPALGFLAHLDTASEVSGRGVQPVLVEHYDGSPIVLSGISLDPAEDPDLAAHKGRAIIHARGDTLLGADDKAGIAEIMGAAEYLIRHPEIPHGTVEIIFSPDEETGKGLPEFPLEELQSRACYTLDGGALGELETECFNAWGAQVEFTGRAIHPGYGRGKMVNPIVMASSFLSMLPRSESPEATDGYYGYYNAMEIKGNAEKAVLEVFIRDFERAGAERRVAALRTFAAAVEAQFPGGTVKVDAKPQYYNMKERIDAHPEVLDILQRAASALGITVTMKPIRGGTDGARLTELGIPTPNIFTGGRRWHSRLEWASVDEMLAAGALVIELARQWAHQWAS
jgi:tripeptide aminopeptidase